MRPCLAPIEPALLMDYWVALLPAAETDAVEEHLFECDQCGDRLRETVALADALRALARSGVLFVVVSEALVQQASGAGQRVREYSVAPGETVLCTVSADDDFLIARLAADLGGTARVDLSFTDLSGVERQRLTDIPIRAQDGGVVLQESVTWAKASPSTSMIARLLAVDANGSEELIAEYTFHHTRTIPGPPGWEW